MSRAYRRDASMVHHGGMPIDDFVPVQRFQPSLAVSPDGHTLAYTANTSGHYDLWLVSLPDGGDARRLTEFTDRAVRSMAWSPDGTRLAFTADRGGDEQHQVYVIDAGGGEPRRVSTADDRQHHLGDDPFSDDGRWLVYAGNDRDPMVQDIVLHDLETDERRRVVSETGLMLFPVEYSPDGSRLLVTGARSNTDSDVFVVELEAADLALTCLTTHEGEARNMAAGWTADGSGVYVITDAGGEFSSVVVLDPATSTSTPFGPTSDIDWDVEEFTTSEDGSVLVWSVNENGMSVLHRRGADGRTVARRDLPPSVIQTMGLTPDGSVAAALVASATRPAEITLVDLVGDEPLRPLTDSRPPGLLAVDPIEPELVTYPTHDGRQIPGWLYRPAGDGPFPVVLSIHGGPEAQERPQYNYAGLYQYLLANGIGVLAPNVRGSTGYGREYQTLIHRDWGGAELGDFEYANRYLRDVDWVDGDRIAVFGGSFGGFATLSCVSRLPDLWAAAVSIVGPSNLQTFVRAVPPTWRSLMRSWVGDAEDDALMLAQRSPLTYADQIVAPLLVIQGANDPRVVQAESDQIVESLRARGVDVEYVVYPDEGHGFTKRENEIDALGRVGDFLIDRLTG
ncbi:MAG: hypothetical protein CL424_12805 [Acidimicrobiaceae bacterium]|nr:hypothetical protein [Acidimicrobiaceae bacterium]